MTRRKPAPPRVEDPRIEFLPGPLKPVAAQCGVEAVEQLMAKLGGQRIYVAKSPGANSKLVKLCGAELAAALAVCYGGEMFNVPAGRSLSTAQRHRAIRADTRSANVVAAAYGMTVNSVYRIRGRRPGPEQLDLIDWIDKQGNRAA